MPTALVYPSAAAAATHHSPHQLSLPQTLRTPSGLAVVEIQGTIKSSMPAFAEDGSAERTTATTPVGQLVFPDYDASLPSTDTSWHKRVHLYVGKHQRLTGEVKKLAKPLALVRKRTLISAAAAADDDNDNNNALEIAEIVHYKILFTHRPEPVGAAQLVPGPGNRYPYNTFYILVTMIGAAFETMDVGEQVTTVKPMTLLAGFAALSVVYFIGRIIYQLFFDPLSSIPGPKLNALTRYASMVHNMNRTTAQNVQDLHKRYGEVVRVSPTEVSFISGETAWQDIYGFRTGKHKGQLNMAKNPGWYPLPPPNSGNRSILSAADAEHSRYRRVFSHAFSEKALNNQEVLIQGYINLMISQLQSICKNGPVDMCKMFNFATFDIIADLSFGESFGCLETLKEHKFIPGIYANLNALRVHYLTYYWPFLKNFGTLAKADPSFQETRAEFFKWVKGATQNRLDSEVARPDFMTEVLKHNGEKGDPLSVQEITNNNVTLLAAGSETTASLLSGVTYLLLRNPAVLAKLNDEVRGTFSSLSDITLDKVNHSCPYMLAVLQEALRYFPPAPTGFQRVVPPGGAVVSGHYLPEGTAVYVSQVALGRSERYFTKPESFIPERWLDDPRFVNDRRDLVQPFNVGPRNCLGKNLAYAEMRLILAKMIYSFDMQLDASVADWMDQCLVSTVWIKPPLPVRLTEVQRE